MRVSKHTSMVLPFQHTMASPPQSAGTLEKPPASLPKPFQMNDAERLARLLQHLAARQPNRARRVVKYLIVVVEALTIAS